MTQAQEPALDSRMRRAVDELTQAIRQRYPEASFQIARGIDEPEQIHLWTTVDLDDPDEVLDFVLDRLLELEIDEGIPLYVIPLHSSSNSRASCGGYAGSFSTYSSTSSNGSSLSH